MFSTETNEVRSRPHSSHGSLSWGLRLLIIAFAVETLAACINAAVLDPNSFRYDLTLLNAVLAISFSSYSIWLIMKRAAVARKFIPAGIALLLTIVTIDYIAFGNGADMAARIGLTPMVAITVAQYVLWIAMGAYVLASKNAKHVLSARLSELPETPSLSVDAPLRQQFKTWPFWRNIAFYFVVFSFVGHWAEMLFCQLIRIGIFMGDYDPSNAMLWSQWLYPFSAEGIAVVLIVLLLYPLKRWLMGKTGNRVWLVLPLSFVITGIVCTCVDFGTGIVANQNYELWDYRALPFNFMGQVCLQNSLVYTVAATLIVWLVYPWMHNAIDRLPSWVANSAFWVLAAMYMFLALLHFVVLVPYT